MKKRRKISLQEVENKVWVGVGETGGVKGMKSVPVRKWDFLCVKCLDLFS